MHPVTKTAEDLLENHRDEIARYPNILIVTRFFARGASLVELEETPSVLRNFHDRLLEIEKTFQESERRGQDIDLDSLDDDLTSLVPIILTFEAEDSERTSRMM